MNNEALATERRTRIPRVASVLGLLLLALAACSTPGEPQAERAPRELSSAERLLARSLDFHDPDRLWSKDVLSLRWTSARPDGVVALDFEIDYRPGDSFAMRGEYGGAELVYGVSGDAFSAVVDGESELSEETRKSAGLAREDGLFWRNYFGFLGGMPMCLRNPQVQLEPEDFEVEFEGRLVRAIRASFSPEVGTDVWTFYFESETAELIGCRFDRADPTRDGETLVFEELVSIGGMQLPKRRTWYMNADRELLGTDELFARED